MLTQERLGEISQILCKKLTLDEAIAHYAQWDMASSEVFGKPGGWLLLFESQIQAQMQPGDELWIYDAPPVRWEHLCGERGMALVRNAKVIDFIMEARN